MTGWLKEVRGRHDYNKWFRCLEGIKNTNERIVIYLLDFFFAKGPSGVRWAFTLDFMGHFISFAIQLPSVDTRSCIVQTIPFAISTWRNQFENCQISNMSLIFVLYCQKIVYRLNRLLQYRSRFTVVCSTYIIININKIILLGPIFSRSFQYEPSILESYRLTYTSKFVLLLKVEVEFEYKYFLYGNSE